MTQDVLDTHRLAAFLPSRGFPVRVEDTLDDMIRVNLAGEDSAVAIYSGQLRALEGDMVSATISDMKTHEQEHKEAFETWMKRYHVRPSFFGFFWHVAGYALGFLSGKLGSSYAMAQTEAVETVIETHCQRQIDQIKSGPFRSLLKKCQLEEVHHKEISSQTRSQHLGLDFWMLATRVGTKVAVRIAKRI